MAWPDRLASKDFGLYDAPEKIDLIGFRCVLDLPGSDKGK
jgi:hypothetical protein